MYTIILVAAIAFLIGIFNCIREWKDSGFDTDDLVLSFVLSFIGAIVGGVIALLFIPSTYVTDKWSENLASLRDNNQTTGSFFLGCGQLNGTMQYVYYIKEDSTTYKMYQCNADQSEIRYIKDTVPTEDITYRHINEDALLSKFSIVIFSEDKWSCIFNVPKGAIKQDFTLNSQ